MKIRIIIALLVGGPGWANIAAINVIWPAGARSIGMANTLAIAEDHWSGFGNPSGLAAVQSLSFGLTYCNLYQIQGLGLGAASIALPVKTGTLGLQEAVFGNNLYHENAVALSFARKFGNRFRGGIGLHFLTIHQPGDYGSLLACIPSLGIQIIPAEALIIGLSVFNPASQSYLPENVLNIPVIIRAGLKYSFSQEASVCLEIEKNSEDRLSYSGGVEIAFQKVMQVRAGLTYGTVPQYSFGTGFLFRRLTIDLAFIRHPLLGYSTALTINFKIHPG